MGLAESEWGPESAQEIFDSWKLDQLASLWAKVEGVPVTDAVRERVESVCRGDDAVRMVLGLYAESRREQCPTAYDDRLPDPDTWERFCGYADRDRKQQGARIALRYFEVYDDAEIASYTRKELFHSAYHNTPVMDRDRFRAPVCLSRVWCRLLSTAHSPSTFPKDSVVVEDLSRNSLIGSFLVSELLDNPRPMAAIFGPNASVRVTYNPDFVTQEPLKVRLLIAGWRMGETA